MPKDAYIGRTFGDGSLSGIIGSYIKQPEPEIKAALKVKLKHTENTFEVCYRLFNSKGDTEYEAAGGGDEYRGKMGIPVCQECS